MNGLTKSELYTLGIGIVIIIILLFFGGKLTSPSRGNYTLPMDQSQASNSTTSTNTTANLGPNISTDPNIQIYDTQVGTGAAAKNGDVIKVNYVGTFSDGTKFDSSSDHGAPIQITLGAGQVIKGWDVGILGMKVGGKRHLVISPAYGYGSKANGPIPANSTLIFDVELVSIGK